MDLDIICIYIYIYICVYIWLYVIYVCMCIYVYIYSGILQEWDILLDGSHPDNPSYNWATCDSES